MPFALIEGDLSLPNDLIDPAHFLLQTGLEDRIYVAQSRLADAVAEQRDLVRRVQAKLEHLRSAGQAAE